MKPVRLSAWSQRMVVAECLAVASLSIGKTEFDVSADEFRRAFETAWETWSPAKYYPTIRPAEIVSLLSGPRTVSDAIAHWQDRRPFRPALTLGHDSPAQLAGLIADYTGIPLTVWEELARGLIDALET